jgi:hypothetical protein
MKKIVALMVALLVLCLGFCAVSYAGTMTSSSVGEPIELVFEEGKENTIDTDAGTLVIRGYSITPQGFVDFTDDKQFGDQSIFTVHATLTVKADQPKSVWGTYKVQVFQKGVDVWGFCDTKKDVHYMTELLPGTPVDLDIDFMVKSDTDPVTFVVTTWGTPKVVFQKEIDLTNRVTE